MSQQRNIVKLEKALSDAVDAIEEKFKKKISGLSTGFIELDEVTSGFEPGQLIVLAARPSMGSSLLALNIATEVAIKGFGVGLFTMGCPATHAAEKILCSLSRVNRMRLRAGKIYNDEWPKLTSGLGLLQDTSVVINDHHNLNLDNHSKGHAVL